MRVIDFTDGFESTSAPSGGALIPLDYLDLNESTIPAAPAALDRRIWVNSSGILQVEDSLAANLVQVNTTSAQTLTNKTLTGNIALNLIGGSSAVITLPSATGTLATLSGTETFTNKTFVDVNFVIGDDIDATKKLKWDLSSITTATTRTWTVPDVSDTLVGLVSTQTITGKTLTGNIALNLVGGSSSVITLPSVTGTLATLANAETLTNKTLTGNIAVNLMSGAATITLPVVTGTLATLAGTETLSNKTLTTPDLGTPSTLVATNITGTATGLTSGKATNISGGLVGQVPYQSAVDTTALLAAGSVGQLLQSNGAAAPSWATTTSGSVVLISLQTASASASIDFTNIASGTYDSYIMVVDRAVPATNNVNLLLRCSVSGTFNAINYAWQNLRWTTLSTGITGQAPDAATGISLDAAGVDQLANTGTHKGGSWTIQFYNAAQTGSSKRCTYQGAYLGVVALLATSGSGLFTPTSAVDGFRFLFDSGNITSGTFALYGVKNA